MTCVNTIIHVGASSGLLVGVAGVVGGALSCAYSVLA